jgi:hypothetical protein
MPKSQIVIAFSCLTFYMPKDYLWFSFNIFRINDPGIGRAMNRPFLAYMLLLQSELSNLMS